MLLTVRIILKYNVWAECRAVIEYKGQQGTSPGTGPYPEADDASHILSPHLRLHLSSCFFLSFRIFAQKLYAFPMSPTRSTRPAHLILLCLITLMLLGEESNISINAV
jgi:hypothetical protein